MNRQILILICAFTLVARAQVGAIDLNRPHGEHEHDYDHEHEKSKRQKYTCPMHPEVVMDHPGNCPKCGMKLVPMKQNKRRTSNAPRRTSNSEHMMHHGHDMAMRHHDQGGQEMHPPSHQGHEMQMEMHSSIDVADPMNREGSGTSWLPDSSPMYGRMFMFGSDMLMLHGAIFPRYTNVSTRFISNWRIVA